ncbi:FNDC9 protein, partial [Alectura lathami]|nr:FNDC9 protein [Alectura lathami]
MAITVQNITGSTAMVIWPRMAGCTDSFYSVFYHPNGNSVLSSYSRQSFQKEERVPASRSSLLVENLTPLTTYLLCVTCQAARPSRDQCRVFHTLEQGPAPASTTKKELALGIWLASSLLLLIIAAVLLYGCLHLLCRKGRERSPGRTTASRQDQGKAGAKGPTHTSGELGGQSPARWGSQEGQLAGIQLATIIENPAAGREPARPAPDCWERVPAAGQCPA